MKTYHLSLEDELQEEKNIYDEELRKRDWTYLKQSSELFLIHAYSHLFEVPPAGYEIFGDANYRTKYRQFYLNLAVGLELLLKSILLKKGTNINRSSKKGAQFTLGFGEIIDKHLNKVFPKLSKNTIEDIKNMLRLINLRRNNIAHRSKRSLEHYAHEYRFSYITLYIYEEFFHRESQELEERLLQSIKRAKVDRGADFKPLRIKPKSLREHAAV